MTDAAAPETTPASAPAPAAPAAATSSLDLPLGDLINQRSKGRGRGNGPRQGGNGNGNKRNGDRPASHPLDRTDNSSSGGAIRHNRRGDRSDARRNDPYGRDSRPQRGGADQRDSWQRDAPRQQVTQRVVGDTIRVSNLDPRNGEEELRYIFEKIGPITRITVNFNQNGQSNGTAEVQFGSNIAAENAVQQLDQAEVDGRLMYVQLVGQLVQTSTPFVQQRRRDDARDERRFDSRGPSRDDRRDERRDTRRDGGRQQGGRNGQQQQQRAPRKEGGEKREKREARPAATAENLDAEMDAYMSSKAAAASADAPAAAPAADAPAPME